jgi:hypothetical protein
MSSTQCRIVNECLADSPHLKLFSHIDRADDFRFLLIQVR